MVVLRAALPRLAAAIGLLLALGGCDVDARVEDLRRMARPGTPNNYLICRSGLCAAMADEDGPFFDQPADRLLAAARLVAAAQPNTEAAAEDLALGQLVFVQRTAWLRFPDIIRVQAIAAPDGRMTLALYSQSVHGYYDFGANKARARAWMRAIRTELGKG